MPTLEKFCSGGTLVRNFGEKRVILVDTGCRYHVCVRTSDLHDVASKTTSDITEVVSQFDEWCRILN